MCLTSDSKVVTHLINLEGVAYLLSSEISSFFWDEDVLTSMVIGNLCDKEARVLDYTIYVIGRF